MAYYYGPDPQYPPQQDEIYDAKYFGTVVLYLFECLVLDPFMWTLRIIGYFGFFIVKVLFSLVVLFFWVRLIIYLNTKYDLVSKWSGLDMAAWTVIYRRHIEIARLWYAGETGGDSRVRLCPLYGDNHPLCLWNKR
jgi:hypothetical protein